MSDTNLPAAALPGAMPDALPEGARAPADFDPITLAKQLLRATRAGALGTLDRNTGHPVTTLVTIATDHGGAPILLISGLSSHTANLKVDGRCSVLLSASGKGDPLAHPRLTVLGEAYQVEEPVARARLRQRFLARHPKAALYADFGDFGFWRLQVAAAHLNGGFARAADIPGAALLTDIADATDLIAAEESAIAHMNEDHGEAVALYATKLAGEAPGPWRMTGVDPEGFDLAANDRTARLSFPERIISGDALHKVLISLAKRARAG